MLIIVASAAIAPTRVYGYAAKSGELMITAELANIITENNQARIIALKGEVQIVFKNQHLRADRAKINHDTKQLEAEGNVVFTTATTTVEGDRISLNYETNIGTVENGYLRMGQVQFEGAIIRKTGPEEYEALEGTYTACTTCPPGWAFTGTRIVAEVGAYSYIRNPILRIARVPVFWLPYLIVPLKSERQSGFLFPSFESSGASGFAVAQSFFWAINSNNDATFTLKNYSLRGIKGLGEYRYALTPDSGGKLNFSYMKDKRLPDQNNGESFPRYFLKYDHMYNLPNSYVHRVNLNLPSDIRYPRHFVDETEGEGLPALENRMSITKNDDRSHASLEAAYYINVLKSGYITDNRDAVHRFPEFRYNLVPREIGVGSLMVDFDVNYLYLTRNTFGYDDRDASKSVSRGTPGDNQTPAVRDGRFDPVQDLYRTGQRIEMVPRVSYPVTLARTFDLLPSVSYHEMLYQFPSTSDAIANYNASNAERRYMRADASLRTRFDRVFGGTEDKATRYKHEMQPEVTYSRIVDPNSTKHPFLNDEDEFFKTNAPITDTDKIQFDYKDRLLDKEFVTFGFVNKLVRRKWNATKADYKQLVFLKLAQSYDMYEASKPNNVERRPYSDISALLDVRLDFFEVVSSTTYSPYQNMTSTASRAKIFNERGDFFGVDYSQDPFSKARTEDLAVSVGYAFDGGFVKAQINHPLVDPYGISSWSTSLNLKPPGNCWTMALNYTKPNRSSEFFLSYSFAFLFDGKTETGVAK